VRSIRIAFAFALAIAVAITIPSLSPVLGLPERKKPLRESGKLAGAPAARKQVSAPVSHFV
jgi:hypothetical protein